MKAGKIFPKGKASFYNYSVLIKKMAQEKVLCLLMFALFLYGDNLSIPRNKNLTFPSWLLKTKHVGIMPQI